MEDYNEAQVQWDLEVSVHETAVEYVQVLSYISKFKLDPGSEYWLHKNSYIL